MKHITTYILILLSLHCYSQSDSILIDYNNIYIDTITSSDEYYITDEFGNDSIVKHGFIFISFSTSGEFYISPLIIGENLHISNYTYNGTYKLLKNNQVKIKYNTGQKKPYNTVSYKAEITNEKIIFNKIQSGVGLISGWQKTRGKYKYIYTRKQ